MKNKIIKFIIGGSITSVICTFLVANEFSDLGSEPGLGGVILGYIMLITFIFSFLVGGILYLLIKKK